MYKDVTMIELNLKRIKKEMMRDQDLLSNLETSIIVEHLVSYICQDNCPSFQASF